MPNISSVIKAIQDIMRKDTGVDGDAQRLSQIVWMLFLKIFADKEVEAEIIDDNYKSPIAEKYRWQTWAKDDEGMTGDELIDFINNDLFPYLQNLENEADKRAFIIKNICFFFQPFEYTHIHFFILPFTLTNKIFLIVSGNNINFHFLFLHGICPPPPSNR